MTYDQMEVLESIVACGSFKAASDKLGKSQPSLSVAIRKLEDEFDILIFDRSHYRPQLTKEGKLFYERAVRALSTFRATQDFAKNLAQNTKQLQFSVSIDSIFDFKIIKDTFKILNRSNPSIEIDLHIDILEGGFNRVKDGNVDFAISATIPENSEVTQTFLCHIEMIPVIDPDAAGSITGDWSRLYELPQMIARSTLPNPNSPSVGLLPGGKRWYVSDNSIKKEMITLGLGWGRLPGHQVRTLIKKKKLVEIKSTEVEKYKVPMYLIKRKDHNLNLSAQKLWQLFIDKFQKEDQT
jgi:DNA-binding transcriptional LysR family regulator